MDSGTDLSSRFTWQDFKFHISLEGANVGEEAVSGSVLNILKKGPMPTRDIHPIIRSIHPDLCNDHIDRIINGVHFGREWKHRVRGAQVDLRRKGLIDLDDGRWRLVREE